jgi:hypothetical protein
MLNLAMLFAMLLLLFALVEKSIIIVGPFAGWNYPKERAAADPMFTGTMAINLRPPFMIGRM